jgi:hypothetical protein
MTPEQSRELDALVAEKVMGWTFFDVSGGQIPKHEATMCWASPGSPSHHREELPFYSTDPTADYSVLVRVRETWGWKMRDAFYAALCAAWTERRTSNVHLGWGDHSSLWYSPGDYSRAALAALGVPR